MYCETIYIISDNQLLVYKVENLEKVNVNEQDQTVEFIFLATGRYWFDDTQLQTPAGVLAGIPTGANSIDDQNFTSDLDYVEDMSNRVFWGRSHGDEGNAKDRNENDYTSQMIFWGLQDQTLDWWNLDLLSLQSTYAERSGLSEEIFQEN